MRKMRKMMNTTTIFSRLWHHHIMRFICLISWFTSPVNSWGHVRIINYPKHTFPEQTLPRCWPVVSPNTFTTNWQLLKGAACGNGTCEMRYPIMQLCPCNEDPFTLTHLLYEPRRQKTGLRNLRPGPTQTEQRNYWIWLEAWNFGFRK